MVSIARVTEASNIVINGWVTTDYGTFPVVFNLPIQQFDIPGTIILNLYFDVGMYYQIMAYSELNDKSYNLTEFMYTGGCADRCNNIGPLNSIMISDGFQYDFYPGGFVWIPTYQNSNGVYESGFMQVENYNQYGTMYNYPYFSYGR